MVGLDTLRIKIPTDGIQSIDYSKFHHTTSKRQGDIETHNQDYVTNVDHGLNRIEVDNLRSDVIISLSAKILKDNYKQSISLNTLDQLTDEINRHGIVNLSADQLMRADVLRCDPVNTIKVDSLDRSVRSILQYANMNSKYKVDPFLTKGSLGFAADRKVKSYKERLIGYSKLHDLKKDKQSREFAVKYPKMVKSFGINDLRVECGLVSFKAMKNNFAVASNTLGSILNSTKNVNAAVFDRIINTGVQMDLFSDHFVDMNMTKLVKEYGYERIFKMFDYDWTRVENWIRLKYPRSKTRNSAGYQIKVFKKAFSRMRKMEVHINTDIEQVSQLLKSA